MTESKALPSYRDIMGLLIENGFEAYLVGGAVRDACLGRPIKDYDVVTNATPDEILAVFPNGKFINATFAVSVNVPSCEPGGFVEIATMRDENDETYVDGKPTDYCFTDDINVDLSRRDATINAIAVTYDGEMLDPYNGMDDIENKTIAAVGEPAKRIRAHPIRAMRYIRFGRGLGREWSIEPKLARAIMQNSHLIVLEPWEAKGAEFMKGISMPGAKRYIVSLRHTGMLDILIPEIVASYNQRQNKFHNFDTVWQHTIRAVDAGVKIGATPLEILAILLHDIAKPETKEYKNESYGNTFYGHESLGAIMSKAICMRLRLSKNDAKLVSLAVKLHMYKLDDLPGARKFLHKLDAGEGNDIDTIAERARFTLTVMTADAMARDSDILEKSMPGKRALVEQAIEEMSAFKVTDLDVNGHDVMGFLDIEQGVVVGQILDALLALVIDGRVKNEFDSLLNAIEEVYDAITRGQDVEEITFSAPPTQDEAVEADVNKVGIFDRVTGIFRNIV